MPQHTPRGSAAREHLLLPSLLSAAPPSRAPATSSSAMACTRAGRSALCCRCSWGASMRYSWYSCSPATVVACGRAAGRGSEPPAWGCQWLLHGADGAPHATLTNSARCPPLTAFSLPPLYSSSSCSCCSEDPVAPAPRPAPSAQQPCRPTCGNASSLAQRSSHRPTFAGGQASPMQAAATAASSHTLVGDGTPAGAHLKPWGPCFQGAVQCSPCVPFTCRLPWPAPPPNTRSLPCTPTQNARTSNVQKVDREHGCKVLQRWPAVGGQA